MYTVGDIAHALSLINRFNGHTKFPYTVAQHSVLVSYLVPGDQALAGLMHDGHEAFVCDIPTPLKMLIPQYKGIEKHCMRELRTRFHLPLEDTPEVKWADATMLYTEQRDMMPPPDEPWDYGADVIALEHRILPWGRFKAKERFLKRFRDLTTDGPTSVSLHEMSHAQQLAAAFRVVRTEAEV